MSTVWQAVQMRASMLALTGLSLSISSAVYGQYFQFSQYNFTAQRINPAMIGTSRYAIYDLASRSQKTGGDFNLNSNFISATHPLLNQSTGRPWSGFGITLMDDRSAGIFRTQEASISYAVNVQLSRFQLLSFGVKGLVQTQRISLDGFYTGSQYIPDRGFSSGTHNGENSQELKTSYQTLSTGLYWQQTDRKGTISGYWSISIFDFNTPQTSFLGKDEALSSTAVVGAGLRVYNNNVLSIFPEFLYTANASNHVFNIGAKFQHEINPLPNQVADRVEVITKYVLGRSGIIGFQFHRENFSVGMSYDFPVVVANVANLGAFEIGLELRKLVLTRARKKTIIRKQQNDKTKKPKIVAGKTKEIQTKDIPDGTITAPLQQVPVEILKTDSIKLKTEAKAGKISHEPLVVEKITLRFHFEFNSTDLDDETEKFLDDMIATLKEDSNIKLKITGHTDNIGHEKFNQRLSLKRAEVVKAYITGGGIAPERLTSEGMGMSQSLNNNNTEADRAKNRRVEMLVYYND